MCEEKKRTKLLNPFLYKTMEKILVYGLGAPTFGSKSVLGKGVGGWAVRIAAKEGKHEVFAVARTPAKYEPLLVDVPSVKLLKGDVGEKESVCELLDTVKPNVVVFAAQAPDGVKVEVIDRDALIMLGGECEKRNIRLIVISSALVSKKNRFHPIRGFLNTFIKWGMMDMKFEGEEGIRKLKNLNYTIIRPSALVDTEEADSQVLAFNQGDSAMFGWKSISKYDVGRLVCRVVDMPELCKRKTFEVMGSGKKNENQQDFKEAFSKLKEC